MCSLEHPKNSLAHHLESWRLLKARQGVREYECHHCMYKPCKKRKRQALITNMVDNRGRMTLVCENRQGRSALSSFHPHPDTSETSHLHRPPRLRYTCYVTTNLRAKRDLLRTRDTPRCALRTMGARKSSGRSAEISVSKMRSVIRLSGKTPGLDLYIRERSARRAGFVG